MASGHEIIGVLAGTALAARSYGKIMNPASVNLKVNTVQSALLGGQVKLPQVRQWEQGQLFDMTGKFNDHPVREWQTPANP